MELDLYGNTGSRLLACYGHALITIDVFSQLATTLVGSVSESGYKEGIGEEARFKYFSSFVQQDASTVLVVANRMIRAVSRSDNSTRVLIGRPNCTEIMDGGFLQACFLGLNDIVRLSDTIFYTNGAQRITRLDFHYRMVTTIINEEVCSSIVLDAQMDIIYLLGLYDVSRYSINKDKLERLDITVQSRNMNTPLRGIILSQGATLLAVDSGERVLRVIDLVRRVDHLICLNDDPVECQKFPNLRGLYRWNSSTILVGCSRQAYLLSSKSYCSFHIFKALTQL